MRALTVAHTRPTSMLRPPVGVEVVAMGSPPVLERGLKASRCCSSGGFGTPCIAGGHRVPAPVEASVGHQRSAADARELAS